MQTLNSDYFTGDVTALHVLQIPSPTHQAIVLAGIGSQLYAFAYPSGICLIQQPVLPYAVRIHGITVLKPSGTTESSTTFTALIAVHGDRHVAIVSLSTDVNAQDSGLKFELLTPFPRLLHWTMDMHLSINNTNEMSAQVAVGLSDNSLEIYSFPLSAKTTTPCQEKAPRLLGRCESSERCLLYSVHLLHRPEQQRYYVAGGTVYLDVVIWSMEQPEQRKTSFNNNISFSSHEDATRSIAARAPLLYKLQGHVGSIHRVRWAPPVPEQDVSSMEHQGENNDDRFLLASASDDRTLRLWSIPLHPSLEPADSIESNGDNGAKDPKELCVLYGHSARLWDICFDMNAGIVISTSEDCYYKIWDIASGKCLRTIQGHRGRGIWRCALFNSTLFTGGNDSGIKCWDLRDWLSSLQRKSAAQLKNNNAIKTTTDNDDSERLHNVKLVFKLPEPSGVTVGFSGVALLFKEEEEQQNQANTFRENHTSCTVKKTNQPQKIAMNSKAEWIRGIHLSKDGNTLFVASNRGIVYQVSLRNPGQEESWTVLYVSSRQSPLAQLRVLEQKQHPCTMLAMVDKSGYAIVIDTNTRAACEWKPYGDDSCGAAGVLDVFFAPELTLLESNRLVFTGGIHAVLTLWKLPESTQTDVVSEPVRLIQVKASNNLRRIVALDACLLVQQQNQTSSSTEIKALVVVGGSNGGLEAFELDITSSKINSSPPSNETTPAEHVSLKTIASVGKVHDVTPVRFIKIIHNGSPDQELRVLSAGGDSSIVHFKWRLACPHRLAKCREERFEAVTTIDGDTSKNIIDASGLLGAPRILYGFHASDFVAVSLTDECELMRVECGGWRRVSTSAVRDLNDITLCYLKAGDVVLHRIRRKKSSPSRSLSTSFHGREINATLLLHSTTHNQTLCFTAGEDAHLRCAVFSNNTTSTTEKKFSQQQYLIGIATAGAALKSVAATEIATDHWLIAAGGSREVLMVWHVWIESDSGVLCNELVQLQVPRKGLRQRSHTKASTSAELRVMALQIFTPTNAIKYSSDDNAHCASSSANFQLPEVAFIVAATSDGVITLLACPLNDTATHINTSLLQYNQTNSSTSQQWNGLGNNNNNHWPVVATFHRSHAGPILSIDTVIVHEAPSPTKEESYEKTIPDTNFSDKGIIVCTGGTDGTLGIWDLAPAARHYMKTTMKENACQFVNHHPLDEADNIGSSSSISDGPGGDEGVGMLLQPLLFMNAWHQSGINSLSVALYNDYCLSASKVAEMKESGGHQDTMLVLVTGGDDQSLRTALLQCTSSAASLNSSVHVSKMCDTLEKCAHSSAIRGVWTDGHVAFSVGLDQKIRTWGVDVDTSSASVVKVGEVGCGITQVLEPGNLAAFLMVERCESDHDCHQRREEKGYKVTIGGRGLEVLSQV